MICPSFNIHGLKSQVPNQASRSTKVIEPRTYFKLVNRLRFWGFYTKPCCVFSDLRMAKCRRSQPGVFEAFNLRHCFVGYRLLANIYIYIYTLYIYIYIHIYIYYIIHIIYISSYIILSTTGTTGEVEKLFRFAELADIQKPPGECRQHARQCTALL